MARLRGTAAPDSYVAEIVTATRKNISLWNGGNGHEWDGSQGYQQHKSTSTETKKSLGKAWAPAYPNVAREWHPVKNANLTPDGVYMGTTKKYWWQCALGHEWQSTVRTRTINGSNCPYCSGRLPVKGETDLATLYPAVAEEWHPTKNGDLTAQDVTAKSGKVVWWQCKKAGHEWQAIIYNRTRRNCPFCAGRRISKGETDLATLNPSLAAEWHPTKNGDLTPQDVTVRSGKKVWWKCNFGHEWQAAIYSRSTGTRCPYCAKKYVSKGETDLAIVHPELVKAWHPTKNGQLTAQDVSPYSHRKVWWRCDQGHEWQAVIANTSKGHGCPYCTGNLPIKGKTDLLTVRPEVAAEWHPNKNGNLTPQDVTANSGKKVWWRCSLGHEWQATVDNRSRTSCPYCLKRRLLVGENDLATLYPDLVTDWHPTKNDGLTPSMITAGSHKKVWWRCEKGHEWSAAVYNRTKGTNCPECHSAMNRRRSRNDHGRYIQGPLLPHSEIPN